jgi:hypothetical protein
MKQIQNKQKNPDKNPDLPMPFSKIFTKESANPKVPDVCPKRRNLGKKPTVSPQG